MNKEIIEIKAEKIDISCFTDEQTKTIEKYTDKKTGRVLGYYKPEIYYAPHNAERITEEEFFKNLGIKKIKTNYDKIKQMTVDEMAGWLAENIGLKCMNCIYNDFEKGCQTERDCLEVITEQRQEWLLQEVEE